MREPAGEKPSRSSLHVIHGDREGECSELEVHPIPVVTMSSELKLMRRWVHPALAMTRNVT
jgi:hypothetical protein